MTLFENILNKYNQISKPAKASMWFVFASIIQKGISLVTTPIFTRILSTEEYGTVSIYNSWLSILTIFATFELATGVFNKAMIKFDSDRDGYTSSTMFLATLISLCFFIVYLIGHNFWNGLLDLNTPMIVMLFMEIIFTISMSFWSIRNRFDFKYKSVVAITLSANTLATLLSVIFVIINSENRAEWRVFGTLLVHIIIYSVIYVVLIRKGGKLVVFDYWKYAIGYNFPLIPHYLSQQILNQSDRIMIGRMINKSSAAIYTVAYQIAIVLNIITNAVHASFMPWTFQKIRDKEYKDIGKVAFEMELCICAACFLFSLFAPELIFILGGETYYEAIWVVPPVAMSIVFNVLYTLIANVAFYYEKTKFIMLGTVLSALTNIVLNYIFIQIYGFVAAGYTTMVCFMLYSIVHYMFMIHICKTERIENPFNGKLMLGIAFLAAALSIVSTSLYRYKVMRYGVIIIFGVVAFAMKSKIISIFGFKKRDI